MIDWDAPDRVELSTLEDAVALLDRWSAAYRELERYIILLRLRQGALERKMDYENAMNNDCILALLKANLTEARKSRFD